MSIMHFGWKTTVIGAALWPAMILAAGHGCGADGNRHHAGPCHHGVPAAYRDLLEDSLASKTGLTFFMPGQSLAAVVTKINDDGTIEGRSQTYERIVIRLHRVNAIAKQ